MRNAISSVAALIVVAAIAVPVAAAVPPVIEPVPAEDFTVPASVCGFEVMVDILTANEKAITFSTGGTLITGALSARLTNADDPSSSIVLNIPGPGLLDESGGLTAAGPWLLFFLPGDLGEGSPGLLVYTTGLVRLDETGFHLLAGRQIDLCAVLASS
jgi:hypothetical protein